MDRYGLVSVSFRALSPEVILREMKRAGLSFIEWGSDVHAPKDDKVKLREISEMQKEYGVSTSSYGSYFRLGESDVGELEGYLSAAKMLSADTLRIWSSNNKTRIFEDASRAVKLAEEYGVVIALECHLGTFTERVEDNLALIKFINSESLKTYWQPFQTRTFEENLSYAERVSDFTRVIHVFNWKSDKRFPLIEGKDEWKAYLEKFKGERTLLLEFMPSDKIEELVREAEALRKISEEK